MQAFEPTYILDAPGKTPAGSRAVICDVTKFGWHPSKAVSTEWRTLSIRIVE